MKVATHLKIDFSSSARTVDNNGFLHVVGVPMFRSGIVEITGMELQAWVPEKLDYGKKYRLRIQQEVIESGVNSFAHKPITWGHKWIGGNTKNDFIGFTGDNPYIEGDLVCDNMTVADTDAVYRIGTKEREELSAGISGEIERSTVPYADYDLLSFECNHVAVVKKGKAGHRVRILNEMVESGEIEGRFLMEENKEVKPVEESKPAEEVKPTEEEKVVETPAKPEETKTAEEPKAKEPEVKADEEKQPESDKKGEDDEKVSEKVDEPVKEEKGSGEKGSEEVKDVQGEGQEKHQESNQGKETPKEETKQEEPLGCSVAWSSQITGVEHSDNPNDPSVRGTTVELSFEEGGVYEYKDGKIARIQLEDIIAENVEKKSNEMIEAFSVCNQIDSGILLDKDTDSMYRSAAKLVFGADAENLTGESLKCMLQGYLLGRSANLSGGCETEKDIRTIEVNL